MNFDEIMEKFNKEGTKALSSLTPEELDILQSELLVRYAESVEKFPATLDKACEAIRRILESGDPVQRFLKDTRNINNN